MRRSRPVVLAALAACCVTAGAEPVSADMTSFEEQVLADVTRHVQAKDCAAAVRRLNEGLAEKARAVWLLAGTLYEEGLCLKPNWDRAQRFYVMADKAGVKAALPRLVSGLLTPVGGQDKGAALWWAAQSELPLPAPCRSADAKVDDVDAFVNALQQWPAGQLDACAYVAGVVATISGDAEFPGLASTYGVRGRIRIDFVPAKGEATVHAEELSMIQLGGVVSGDTLRDRETKAVRGSLEAHLREVTARALKRYAKPAGIDPSWQVPLRFSYEYVL